MSETLSLQNNYLERITDAPDKKDHLKESVIGENWFKRLKELNPSSSIDVIDAHIPSKEILL